MTVRLLFTVDLSAVPVERQAAEIAELAHALHEEFPAFRLVQWLAGDDCAAVVVTADAGTPSWALARLDGWGHGSVTLRSLITTVTQ